MTRTSVALCLAAVLATAAGSALAADPSDGTVSAASPSIAWSGTVTESYPSYAAVFLTHNDQVPCQSPSCDAFALKVADAGELTIAADSDDTSAGASAPQVVLRVHKPDGSTVIANGETSAGHPLAMKIKDAPAGAYTVDYFNNHIGQPIGYKASAVLRLAAAPAPAPPAGGPPAGTDAPKQDLAMTVKAARVAPGARRMPVTVTVSRRVKSVAAVLRSGSKTIGRGRLGAFSGTAKLALKAKGLRAGTYSLTVTADDGAGVRAVRVTRVRVAGRPTARARPRRAPRRARAGRPPTQPPAPAGA